MCPRWTPLIIEESVFSLLDEIRRFTEGIQTRKTSRLTCSDAAWTGCLQGLGRFLAAERFLEKCFHDLRFFDDLKLG